MSPPRPHNMVNFGLLTAEICWRVSGTPANFNGFRVLAALLHGTLVLGVSQTLRRLTEGATYIQQGNHHITLGIGCIQDSVAVVNATRNDVLVVHCIWPTGLYMFHSENNFHNIGLTNLDWTLSYTTVGLTKYCGELPQ